MLPAYLNEITVKNLRIDADCTVALQIRKIHEEVTATVLNGDDVRVEVLKESLVTA